MMTAAVALALEKEQEQDMTEANARWAAGCLNHEGHIRTRVVPGEDGWAVEVYDDEDGELLFIITAIRMVDVTPEQPEAS
jgi:hypothetical protein